MAVGVVGGATPEEYLALERSAEFRSEYIAGKIVPMSPAATRPHNLIVSALSRCIGEPLQDGPCELYMNEMRVKVIASGDYLYPDLAVSCDPEFEDRAYDTLLSPVLIIEVLSESTEGYDRRKKFDLYRRIESLREYVLISEKEPRAERQVRHGNSWHFDSVEGLNALLAFASHGVEIPLNRFYEKALRPTQRVRRAGQEGE
jgi:Uma2 family endonuclease